MSPRRPGGFGGGIGELLSLSGMAKECQFAGEGGVDGGKGGGVGGILLGAGVVQGEGGGGHVMRV